MHAAPVDAAAIRYTNLIDELDTVMDRITYFTRRKKFADENWVKVQKSLKTGRSAAQFLEQLNKSKTLRLKQLKDARDESYGKFGSAAKKSGKINR